MTKKIIFSIILVILIFIAVNLVLGKFFIGKGISEIEDSSRRLKILTAQLEKVNASEFADKEKELEDAVKQYNEVKDKYAKVIEKNPNFAQEILDSQEYNYGIYDIEFLWTTIGNYATNENLKLDLKVQKNSTSIDSVLKSSDDYEICDLEITVSGEYLNLSNFIYNLENDISLGFKINEFDMDYKNDIEVKLNIQGIRISSDNLLDIKLSDNELAEDLSNATNVVTPKEIN